MGGLFSKSALQSAVDTELNKIELPNTCRGALVGYYDTDGTWRLSVVHRTRTGWQIEGAVGSTPTGIQGGVRVMKTW